ncbi:FG-GAP repeat domain-containing protein, partial [Streptomyces spiralis]
MNGTMVYAFATKPLTGTPGDGAGLPEGVTFGDPGIACKPAPQAAAVYLCRVAGTGAHAAPVLSISPQTADNTSGYWGAVYAPAGSDLNAAIHAAQTAGATPADGNHGAGTFTVKTPEHVAQNTLSFTAPAIESGKSSPQTLHVHAVDGGHLDVWFGPGPEQYGWNSHHVDIRVTALTAGATAQCTHGTQSLSEGLVLIQCDLQPGDTDIVYTLTSAAGTESWKINAHARYKVYSYRTDYRTADATFAVDGPPVRERHVLMGRDSTGNLWYYHGTGTTTPTFERRSLIGGGWQGYNALTRLCPLTDDKPTSGFVARDGSGVLWRYSEPSATRSRVGAGWNTYTSLTGAGDLTGDAKADLVARDASGTLWLYRGTGNTTAPFATRTKIGAGWNTYNSLAGSDDLTGDAKADLVARDASGTLWLYRGTGNTTAPFATRTKIGAGWNTYNRLVVTGDLTGDAKADLVARDASGTLW